MIYIKSASEIMLMQKAGSIVAGALRMIAEHVVQGVRTCQLDQLLEQYMLDAGAIPSFKGYNGYQHASCISVNSAVVHGIPSQYVLVSGDIVGIDIAANYQGYHADAARTFGVGRISGRDQRLIDCAQDCFWAGVQHARAGCRVGDISAAVQEVAESRGYSVVTELAGHGIGRSLHEDPSVPNYGRVSTGARLRAGYALAIEPMINIGARHTTIDSVDKWTVRTKDGGNSAHYENTVIVTDTEPEVITL
jgi:methionyl aminopeptidase